MNKTRLLFYGHLQVYIFAKGYWNIGMGPIEYGEWRGDIGEGVT
jgi:hypothetical protein